MGVFFWERTGRKRESGSLLNINQIFKVERLPFSWDFEVLFCIHISIRLQALTIYSEMNALKYSSVLSGQKSRLGNRKSYFLTPDNCIRWDRKSVIWLMEDLNVVLIIYGSFQHINIHIMMFKHNESPILHLHYCIVTGKQKVKRMHVFHILYMFIGYVGFDIPVVTMQKGLKSDIASVLTQSRRWKSWVLMQTSNAFALQLVCLWASSLGIL